MSQWISVKDRLPDENTSCLVYTPSESPEEPDCINIEWFENDCWMDHENSYEHFRSCAPAGSIGPPQDAPYTHWMPLPEPPTEVK